VSLRVVMICRPLAARASEYLPEIGRGEVA